MTNKMQLVNTVFDTGAWKNFIREDFLVAVWFRAIQANNQSKLKNATNQNLSVVVTIMLHTRKSDSTVRLFFGVERNLAVPVLFGTLLINRFLKSVYCSERRMIRFNSMQVANLAPKCLPEEHKDMDKAKDLLITEEEALWQARASRKTKNQLRSEDFVSIVTDARVLVQIGPLLEWDSSEAWTTGSGIIDAIPNRSLNVKCFNLNNAPLSLC